jgi:hypothetical protein
MVTFGGVTFGGGSTTGAIGVDDVSWPFAICFALSLTLRNMLTDSDSDGTRRNNFGASAHFDGNRQP